MATANCQPQTVIQLDPPRFDLWIVAWLLMALAFASWTYAPTRPLWDELDKAVFRTTNAAIAHSSLWRSCCAAANSDLFDGVAAVMTGCLLVAAAATRRQTWKAEALDLALLVGAIGLAQLVILNGVLEGWCQFQRASPTLTLDAVRLSELERWIPAKDSSHYCFPSDHGIVVLAVAMHVMILAPAKRAWAACYAFVFASPRIFAGAHWFTDVAIGSGCVAMTAITLVMLTRPWLMRRLAFRTEL